MTIRNIKARTIHDSTASPTLEVDLMADDGLFRSSVPNDIRYNPKGYEQLRQRAVGTVNDLLGPSVLYNRFDEVNQKEVDTHLTTVDGHFDRSRFGTVTAYAISTATCKAGAAKLGIPVYKHIAELAGIKKVSIPVPAFNLLEGGMDTKNKLVFRDYLCLPVGATSFKEAYYIGRTLHRRLELKLAEMEDTKAPLPTTPTGALLPKSLENDEHALRLIEETIHELGFNDYVKLQINIDAVSFYSEQWDFYNLNYKNKNAKNDFVDSRLDLRHTYENLINTFPRIVSLEDPYQFDDYTSWKQLKDLPIQIVANELIASKGENLVEAMNDNCGNCVVIEPWKCATLTEALIFSRIAAINKYEVTASSGYGQTDDTFMADFAVGMACGIFKGGAPNKTSSYNQLLRIEKELGRRSVYSGKRLMELFKR